MEKFAPLAEERIVALGRKRETAVEVGGSKEAHFRGRHATLSFPTISNKTKAWSAKGIQRTNPQWE
jgi:hypothetical protein